MLTLLTKCGVVVGVFGLGPKGRGLDSLHLVGAPMENIKEKVKSVGCGLISTLFLDFQKFQKKRK